ncbi:MAG: GAF domain-containing protein [Planctomycetes bacterium]|nr:GAF domain-containing protein [Planctomycetota bacterium]
MSSEQAVNADTIEQTKQQIRGLVSEIAQLSKSDLDADEYFAAFLQKVVSALAAIGGAVWILREGRRLELAYQIRMNETLLDSESQEASRHFGLLSQIVGSGEPALVPPQSGVGEDQTAGNPTNSLLVLVPLRGDNQVEGVVEVFQRSDAQPVTQRGYLKFVIQMCELAGEWLKTRKLRQISDRHSLWAQADHFSRMVHETLDLRETAYTVVNEGRRMIGCDRVSVGIMRGRKCTIEAVSGQDAIENRSNIVNFLGQLSTRVVATGESLWYDGSTEDLPPQVERALDTYIDESHTKMMAVLPLRRPKRSHEVRQTVTGEADEESNEANEIVGVLVVEQIESNLPEELLRSRTDLVYEHSARALTNSVDHSSIPLMPVWRAVGKMGWMIRARSLPKSVIILAALLVVIVSLFVIRKDFNIESRGALQPVVKKDVFVPVDGTVIKVYVEDQKKVKAGDPLVDLRNPELEVQFQEVLGQIQTKQKRLSSVVTALLKKSSLSEVERTQLGGEKLELLQQLETLGDQRDVLEEKRDMLKICAPIDGQIMMDWDVQKSLLRRPVTTGQVLMSVADPAGDWELELYMRESRVGHVRTARNDKQWRDIEPEPGKQVPGKSVTFILATNPGADLAGAIKEIKDATEVHPEEGVINKIKVGIERKAIGNPHPGATVTADVYCGRSSVAYAWFHEAWEWVQARIIFYLS